MNKKLLLYSIILIVGGVFSCVPHKKVIYFQKDELNAKDSIAHFKYRYKVQAHDVLDITISSINPQLTNFFNLGTEGVKSDIKGYTVSDSGYIYMPVFDSVKVKGLTIAQIQSLLLSKVKQHVSDATVAVKLASFKLTILGEVRNPGLQTYMGEELTILEALGLAGDISDFGNRQKIQLIRTNGTSSKFAMMDITSRSIMESEYFYIHPNDVIYVEPLRAKTFKQNISQISLALGFVSFIFIVLNFTR